MIALIVQHWLLPGKAEQARALFAANTEGILKMPGLVGRYVLRSTNDPLKWTTVTIWDNEQAAKAWQDSPDHIWDVFGGRRRIPTGTEYARTYGDATCVDAKAAVGEAFELTTAVLPGFEAR